jgi:hypothetical protein
MLTSPSLRATARRSQRGARGFWDRLLGCLVASGQQDHDFMSAFDEINSVSGAEVETHLRDAIEDGAAVAEVSLLGTANADRYPLPSHCIPEPVEPSLVDVCGPDRLHTQSVGHGLQYVNHGLQKF